MGMRNRSAQLMSIAVAGAVAACSSAGGKPAAGAARDCDPLFECDLRERAVRGGRRRRGDLSLVPRRHAPRHAGSRPSATSSSGDKGGGRRTPGASSARSRRSRTQQGTSIVIQTSPGDAQRGGHSGDVQGDSPGAGAHVPPARSSTSSSDGPPSRRASAPRVAPRSSSSISPERAFSTPPEPRRCTRATPSATRRTPRSRPARSTSLRRSTSVPTSSRA